MNKLNLQISDIKIRSIFNWLSRNNNIDTLELIFKEKIDYFYKLKNKYEKPYNADCAAFILTLEKIFDEQELLNKKNKNMSLKEIKRAQKIKQNKYKNTVYLRKKEKLDFLQDHISVILEMKEIEKLGVRKIAQELKRRGYIKRNSFKYSEPSISHTYVHQFIQSIKNG